MRAERVIHKNEQRIKIEFLFSSQTVSRLREIKDARWSQTLNSWHIPYTGEAFKQLTLLFPDIAYKRKQEVSPKVEEVIKEDEIAHITRDRNGIYIDVIGRQIIIKLPKNEGDIRLIRSLKYSRWDSKHYSWIVPAFPGNLELLKDFLRTGLHNLLNIKPRKYRVAAKHTCLLKTK